MDTLSRPIGRFVRLLAHRRFPLACVLLALLVALPTLTVGFFADDYMHIAFLEKKAVWNPAWWDLYRFTPDDPHPREELTRSGMLPWWTAPTFALHFFRPLTSALFTFDHAVFGHNPIGYHVHTVLWWLALVAAVGLLFRVLLPGALGHLALLLFVLDDGHAFPITWIACRHMIVGAALSLLGFAAYASFRERGFRAGRWLGPLGLVAGLLASEVALGVAAYWLAYELVGRGDRAAGTSWRSRWVGCLPLLVLMGAYMMVYRALGCGARASGGYVDPGSDPGLFLARSVERIPILAADAIAGVPSDLAPMLRKGPLIAAGLVATLALVWMLRALASRLGSRESRMLWCLAMGTAMSLPIGLGGFLTSRILLVPSLGIAALVASIVLHGFRRATGPGRRVSVFALRAGAGALVLMHVVVAPFVLVKAEETVAKLARRLEQASRTAEIAQAKRVIVLATSDPMASFYPSFIRKVDGGDPAERWFALSAARGTYLVTRTGPSSFRFELRGAALLRSSFENIFRRSDRLYRAGDVVELNGMRITVAAVDAGAPTALEVLLDVPIDDPSIALLEWHADAFRRVTLPLDQTLTNR